MRIIKPDCSAIQRQLASRLHSHQLLDRSYRPGGKELTLAQGYNLRVEHGQVRRQLKTCLDDFHRFMSVCMGMRIATNGYPIMIRFRLPDCCPAKAQEAYCIDVSPDACEITAGDLEGARRAMVRLEDEMLIRRSPCLPLGKVSRWAVIEARIAHSPYASNRFMGGWELEDRRDYYPEEYLNKLAHCGINGIWVNGLVRRLIRSRLLPELGPRAHRLGKLRKLTEKADRYGIKVYFFCIEPRAIPDDHPVLAAHPEIRGARMSGMTSSPCTSVPLVQEYIRETMRELFREVPLLGGIINIFNGERATNCWLDAERVLTCPRCSRRKQWEVLAEDLNCFYEGMQESSPAAKLIAWGYSMDTSGLTERKPVGPRVELINRLNPGIICMDNFEHGGKKLLCGKTVGVHEYSLSYIGPSSAVLCTRRAALQHGNPVYAKLQTSTTHELTSVPYLPVPGVLFEKFSRMHKLGFTGAMAQWLHGGMPSFMLKAVGEASFVPLPGKRRFLERLASIECGIKASSELADAWSRFSDSFLDYPSSVPSFYFGPITRAPAYQLHLEKETRHAYPYNFGISRFRELQPWEDDVGHWLKELSAEELIRCYRRLGQRWQEALRILKQALRSGGNHGKAQRQIAVAAAAGKHFVSAANIVEFFTLRDRLLGHSSRRRSQALRRMRELVLDEIRLAREMKACMRVDPSIGYFTEIMTYCYTITLINEKIRHARRTLKILDGWIRRGVDEFVLRTTWPFPRPGRQREASSRLPPRNSPEWMEWMNWYTQKPTWREWLQHGD